MEVSEGAAQSMLPVAQATVPEVGRMEEDTAEGTAGVMVMVERTSGGFPRAWCRGQPLARAG